MDFYELLDEDGEDEIFPDVADFLDDEPLEDEIFPDVADFLDDEPLEDEIFPDVADFLDDEPLEDEIFPDVADFLDEEPLEDEDVADEELLDVAAGEADVTNFPDEELLDVAAGEADVANFPDENLLNVPVDKVFPNVADFPPGLIDLVSAILKVKRDRPEDPIGKYLLKHPSEKESHANYEKELQTIVLLAAENGYIGTLRKAIPVIRKVEGRLYKKVARPGVNFNRGRRSDGIKQFYTPLVYACEGGSRELVELLLDEGAKLDYVGSERIEGRNGHKKVIGSRLSALHVACVRGREDIVTLLLTRPKKNLLKKTLKDVLNARTKDQWTPLMYAVKEGHVQVVKVLLEQESLEALVRNKKGQTALHIAGLHSRLDCLRELHASLSLRESSREKLALVDDNPYMQADKKGYNVLHRICKGPRGTGGTNVSVEALQWVFETMPHLDKPEILNQGTREEGYSMLLLACDNGNRGLVEYLLVIKAVDVGSTTKDGKTGLHLAALHDYPEIAELLLSHGISITVQDSERKDKDSDRMIGEDTALHIAVRKSSFDVEKKIRSCGGIAEILNKLGETPATVKSDETIPLEIRRLGEDAIQRYKQLLRKGKQKKMPRCNLIALGEQGVGKTSLLCLLMGEKFLEKRDSTRGIDHDDINAAFKLVELLNVSSEEWTRVKADVIAQRNQEQFVSSVAEELKPHFHGKKESEKQPQPGELEADISKIDQYLDEVEQKAKMLQEDPPKVAPSQQPQAMKGAAVFQRSDNSSQKLVRNVDKPTVPSEKKKPAKKTKAEQPKVIPLPFSSPSQPPVPPSRTQIETLPATGEGGGTGNSPRVRDANFGRRMSKSIVASAKEKSNVVEPVLQYKTLDFAGQPEYRAMHHCFIVRRAIYLMVFNLQSVIKAIEAPDEKNKRAFEEIQYWLNSIHAHIHRLGPEPDTLKRILLVGTHRGEMIEDDIMKIIDKKLIQYIEDSPLYNDMYRAGGKVWFAAVENSIDGEEEREESGASSLQVSIRDAWNDLPFKNEEYPSTWLLFEEYLHRQRDMHQHNNNIVSVASIKSIARREYGIGEDSDEDAELALGFFHDTGTIIYPKKHPSLYLTGEQKEKLDSLVLLDPSWLTMMMRNVMEIQTGKGSKLANDKIKYLEKTGCVELSSLRKGCWSELSDDDLDNLILMLQSFCIIFPLPPNEVPAPIRSVSMPIPSTEDKADTDELKHGQSEEQTPPTLDTVYLIPSKLSTDTRPFPTSDKYKFTFVFDFRGFLPEQVYHRLLCLMLKRQSEGKSRRKCETKSESIYSKPKGEFTAHYFEIKRVEQCNWMVQKVESKLYVSVYFPPGHTCPPSSYVDIIHDYFLVKICDEKGSSLQGVKYVGGPEHKCTQSEGTGAPVVVVPYVTYPEEMPLPFAWQCDDCLITYDDINVLLDPTYKQDSVSNKSPNVEASNDEVRSKDATNTVIHAQRVVVAEPYSNVIVQDTPSSTGLCLRSSNPNSQIAMSSKREASRNMIAPPVDSPHISVPVAGNLETDRQQAEHDVYDGGLSLTPKASIDQPQEKQKIMSEKDTSSSVKKINIGEDDGASGLNDKEQTTSAVPRLAQLKVLRIQCKPKIEIIKTVSTRWKDIGILMDFDATGKKLQLIEKDKHEVEACCLEMFQHWLEGNGKQPASWKTLVHILKDCDFKALASKITDAIQSI